MEINTPIWNRGDTSYSFRILKSPYERSQSIYYEGPTDKLDLPADTPATGQFLSHFLLQTKKYFTNPLTLEKIFRHLRHTVADSHELPTAPGTYTFTWKPHTFTIKSGDFNLSWFVASAEQSEMIIPAEFIPSTTPRAQSPENQHSPRAPEQTAAELRNIQIHDSLIPVGDLPLSDLPPLSFHTEESDPQREVVKRRVREARLKVQLAKLKAQRMEQKYYERYGQDSEDSEDSSEFSSDSEEEDEIPFEHHSHS